MPKRPRETEVPSAASTVEGEDVVLDFVAPPAPEDAEGARPKSKSKQLSAEALEAYNAAERAKGIVYLGRIPPGMKPIKLRHLLSRFGEIGRVYLAPEDPAVFKRRVASGGSRRLNFVEGWVEFSDRRAARATAASIHSTPMEGTGVGKSKRDKFVTELWNISYLKNFKWHHLTEKVAYERKLRAVKLRGQLSAAKKEAEAYLARVEQGKALQGMQEKRGKKGGAAAAASEAPRRSFKQLKEVG